MKNLLVIHETDLEDNERSVIGVCNSTENAELLVNEYYGDHKVLKYFDIRDSNLEWEKKLEVKGSYNEPYEVKIWAEWFTLNEA